MTLRERLSGKYVAEPEVFRELNRLIVQTNDLVSRDHESEHDVWALEYLHYELPILFAAACKSIGVDANIEYPRFLDEIEDLQRDEAAEQAKWQHTIGLAIAASATGTSKD